MKSNYQEKVSEAADSLLEGALEVFAKYGFAKTAMSDIAAASSVSRTSLYKHFPTKEHVFKALSEKMNSGVYNEVVMAYGSTDDPVKQLRAVINARVSWVYDLLHRSPFARELINEKNRICGNQVLAANDRFSLLVKELLSKIAPESKNAELVRSSRVLISAVNGILESCDTSQDAKADVELLIRNYIEGIKVLSVENAGAK